MAVGLLKLRKHKLRDVENVEKQLLTVYEMISTISMTTEEMKVIKALKAGKDALESLHKEMSVDAVLELMDDVFEQNQIEKEISSILTNGIGGGLSVEDEMEVEAELNALEEKVVKDRVVAMGFPAVPNNPLPENSLHSSRLSSSQHGKIRLVA